MARRSFTFFGEVFEALASGGLFWPARGLLCVSDLHLGKAQRPALAGGAALPPYEVRETLDRLAADLAATGAERVVALGDSFDDPGAPGRLSAADRAQLASLVAGVDWLWIAGNHDPAPTAGGAVVTEVHLGALVLRHEARHEAEGEISGHYHPSHCLPGARSTTRAFLLGARKLILPAYGAYAGGLRSDAAVFRALIGLGGRAILTHRGPGPAPDPLPMVPMTSAQLRRSR